MRFERPGRVGSKLSRDPERTQELARFHVSREDHRILDVALAHGLYDSVHVARLAAVSKRNLVFCRGQTQRNDHHRRQGIGKLALEHRAFASDDAVILTHLAKEKRWKHIGEMDLARALKITACEIEILGHDAEINVFGAKDMPNLAQRFLHAQVRPRIPIAVVTGKEQPQLFARRPAFAEAQHPAQACDLNQRADPGDEEEVRHARALPAAKFFSAPGVEGHGLAGNWNLFSRPYFRSGAA